LVDFQFKLRFFLDLSLLDLLNHLCRPTFFLFFETPFCLCNAFSIWVECKNSLDFATKLLVSNLVENEQRVSSVAFKYQKPGSCESYKSGQRESRAFRATPPSFAILDREQEKFEVRLQLRTKLEDD